MPGPGPLGHLGQQPHLDALFGPGPGVSGGLVVEVGVGRHEVAGLPAARQRHDLPVPGEEHDQGVVLPQLAFGVQEGPLDPAAGRVPLGPEQQPYLVPVAVGHQAAELGRVVLGELQAPGAVELRVVVDADRHHQHPAVHVRPAAGPRRLGRRRRGGVGHGRGRRGVLKVRVGRAGRAERHGQGRGADGEGGDGGDRRQAGGTGHRAFPTW